MTKLILILATISLADLREDAGILPSSHEETKRLRVQTIMQMRSHEEKENTIKNPDVTKESEYSLSTNRVIRTGPRL
jgi:hypothetical protein